MTDFVIEKGVPMPTDTGRIKAGRPRLYRWEEMEVGDSVKVSTYEAAKIGQEWGRRRGLSFSYQKQDDRSGWRVWRTE